MFCRYCGKELIPTAHICYSCGAEPIRSTGSCCVHCGGHTMPLARICLHCSARLTWKPARSKRRAIYNPAFDLDNVSLEQRIAFARHRVTWVLSIDALIFLHIATLGLFTLIYFGLMHSRMPMVKYDDFAAKRAIGFSFIPFFNLYWLFRFWLRLADRVGLQTRLRGFRQAIPESLMRATVIVSLIPVAGFASLIMYPICIGLVQKSCNEVVPGRGARFQTVVQDVL
ncbi:MAG: hypothetical protein ACNA7X_02325 [Dehalococcoidia bacterium]